jgi:hypothetical protein
MRENGQRASRVETMLIAEVLAGYGVRTWPFPSKLRPNGFRRTDRRVPFQFSFYFENIVNEAFPHVFLGFQSRGDALPSRFALPNELGDALPKSFCVAKWIGLAPAEVVLHAKWIGQRLPDGAILRVRNGSRAAPAESVVFGVAIMDWAAPCRGRFAWPERMRATFAQDALCLPNGVGSLT